MSVSMDLQVSAHMARWGGAALELLEAWVPFLLGCLLAAVCLLPVYWLLQRNYYPHLPSTTQLLLAFFKYLLTQLPVVGDFFKVRALRFMHALFFFLAPLTYSMTSASEQSLFETTTPQTVAPANSAVAVAEVCTSPSRRRPTGRRRATGR